MREAVAAANEYVRREVERNVAAGHSSHFMADGRYFERTRDGVFELVRVGDELVRSDQHRPSKNRTTDNIV
jgi:hypothetical protein